MTDYSAATKGQGHSWYSALGPESHNWYWNQVDTNHENDRINMLFVDGHIDYQPRLKMTVDDHLMIKAVNR